MDDVRGDILGPPHGIILAAVIANKNKIRKGMGHTAVSATRLSSDIIDLAIYMP